jgi:TolB-like protein/Tfp pilus assembly protein PilF
MELLSRIAGWLGENEATISAVVGITVLAGVLFAGFRSLLRSRAETARKRALGGGGVGGARDSSGADLGSLPVPGFEDRHAIAVLPFDNLSGDPDQEYFADGIAEDLLTRLSAWREFPVIARNSSFTYKGKPVDVKQVGRELSARYVVEGSVRKIEDRVRIAIQLIEATTAAHVWAETYDRQIRDIFELQDEIAETVARSAGPALQKSEWKRSSRKKPQQLDAWDSHWRGWWHYTRYSKDENAEARLHFQRATELDPKFASALAGLAVTHCADVRNQWSESPVQSLSRAEEAIRRAVELDDDDPFVHFVVGDLRHLTGQTEAAVAALERALQLDPSYVHGYLMLGMMLATMGKPEQAIEHAETAMRLSPKDPFFHMFLLAASLAHAAAGRDQESVDWAQKSLQVNSSYPLSYLVLAAGHANLGHSEEARATVQALLKMNPASSLTGLKVAMSSWHPAFAGRSIDALRKAGLPE